MRSVLIIAPYENIYPPMNGGMQRCFHIMNQLATHFDLTAIIHQDKDSFLKAASLYPAISSIKIYSTGEEKVPGDVFNLLPGNLENSFRYRWIKKDFTKPADGSFLKYYPVLKRLLKNYKYDTVILENLFTTNAVKTIRKYAGKATIIYDAHNVDSNLAQEIADGSGISTTHLRGIRKAESDLYKTVDAIFTCSEKDKSEFLKMNQHQLKAAVIPNGVNIGQVSDLRMQKDIPDSILFCGALWTLPNSEGLLWFYNSIWATIKKTFPQLQLLIVGSGKLPKGCEQLMNDSSLVFTGTVDEVQPWYNKAAVSIVPLLNGSGTRLKILEAMSFGLPVVSTSKGAEGIDYTDEKDIIIADEAEEYANQLINLLANKERRISIGRGGRELVEKKYNWNIIGKKIEDFVNSINQESRIQPIEQLNK
jgi:glycosyltransferase involved in cell wall biosynthesis